MEAWIIAALLANFIFALVSVGDKFLLSSVKLHHKEYAFYAGLFSWVFLFAFPFIEINFALWRIILAILAGLFFAIGLVFYFKILNKFDASQILTAVNAMVPVFSFVLGYWAFIFFRSFVGDFEFSIYDISAIIFLILGSTLISSKDGKLDPKSIIPSCVSALFFASSFLMMNVAYSNGGFVEGFLWNRVGWVIFTIIMFFDKELKAVLKDNKFSKINPKRFVLLAITQTGGGTGSFLQNYAFSLASFFQVSIINALQGFQYIFLFLFGIIGTMFFPKIIKEDISFRTLMKKTIAMTLIIFGLVLISIF